MTRKVYQVGAKKTTRKPKTLGFAAFPHIPISSSKSTLGYSAIEGEPAKNKLNWLNVMPNYKQLMKLFTNIQIVRSPKHRLATFGDSKISYFLVTDVPSHLDRAKVRTGLVTAEKPAIITPQTLKEQFLGFSPEAERYADWLISHYGEALRGLEYQFKNELAETRIELMTPELLLKKLAREIDDQGGHQSVLIRGSEKFWELSVMKFIVEETLSSFAANLQELHERGFFERGNRGGDKDLGRRHREVRTLLEKARANAQLVPEVGKKLKEYGLFDQYQDAFFSLINR